MDNYTHISPAGFHLMNTKPHRERKHGERIHTNLAGPGINLCVVIQPQTRNEAGGNLPPQEKRVEAKRTLSSPLALLTLTSRKSIPAELKTKGGGITAKSTYAYVLPKTVLCTLPIAIQR